MSAKMLRAANQFRKDHPNISGGVVIFHQGKVQGWMNEIRSPESWVPGSIALAESGEQWVAQGGNDYDGAKRWVPIKAEVAA